MKKIVNGKVVDMTPEEIAERTRQAAIESVQEKARPMTRAEVLEWLIPSVINEADVDNNTALRAKEFYPTFEDIVGKTVRQGYKFTHADKLWAVVQAEITIQAHYPPGPGMESLYAEVCETHSGELTDPIPYSGNMALTAGLHYTQDGVIYRCIRDTGLPVYHALADLVGLYVEVIA